MAVRVRAFWKSQGRIPAQPQLRCLAQWPPLNLVPAQGGSGWGQLWSRFQGMWARGKPSCSSHRHGLSPGEEECDLPAPAGRRDSCSQKRKGRKVKGSKQAIARSSAACTSAAVCAGVFPVFPDSLPSLEGHQQLQLHSRSELWACLPSSSAFP